MSYFSLLVNEDYWILGALMNFDIVVGLVLVTFGFVSIPACLRDHRAQQRAQAMQRHPAGSKLR